MISLLVIHTFTLSATICLDRTWIVSVHVMIFVLFSLFPRVSPVSLSTIDTCIFLTIFSVGIFHYRSVCVVNLPVGKPPKGLVLRSRYPQGNRPLCVVYSTQEYETTPHKAVMLPKCSGFVSDDARTRCPNRGKLPCVL